MVLQDLKARTLRAIDEAAPEIGELASKLHMHPEVSLEERKACGWLTAYLSSKGFDVESPWGGLETAFRAVRRGRGDGPGLCYVAEYDALEGIGHACGHNLFATAAIGAATGLAAVIELLEGDLMVIGTPAEEEGNGKVIMIENGAFEGVDYALMAHAGVKNMVCRPTMAGVGMSVSFSGLLAHSKEPWKGVNALQAVLELFRNVDGFRATCPPRTSINGIVTEGGNSTSTITDFASCKFSVQGRNKRELEALIEKMRNAVRAAEIATEATAAIEFENEPLLNRMPNSVMAGRFKEYMGELGVEFGYAPLMEPMGLSDAGNLSHIVPLIHPYFKIADESISSHSPAFERCAGTPEAIASAILVAKGLALTGCDILSNAELRERIGRAFEEDLGQS